jgi:hypothetical protein
MFCQNAPNATLRTTFGKCNVIPTADIEVMGSWSRRPSSVARVGGSDSTVAASDHHAPVSESWKSPGSSLLPGLDLKSQSQVALKEATGLEALTSMFLLAVQS